MGSNGLTPAFVLKGIVLFVIIATGVFAGIALSFKLGLGEKLNPTSLTPQTLRNDSDIQIDQIIPSFTVVDSDGNTRSIEEILTGRKTLIGILSDGCQPCHIFAEFAKGLLEPGDKEINIVVLSQDPVAFESEYGLVSYQIDDEFLTEMSIHTFPTLVGVDENLNVKFVSSGLSQKMKREFFEENL